MHIVRDVFQAKPGKAKNLVEIFKTTSPHIEALGARNIRVLTDTAANYWTVVWEFEVDSVGDYFTMLNNKDGAKKVGAAMHGYMDLVQGGHREIFKIE